MNALVLALALAAAPADSMGGGCVTFCGLRAPLEANTCESLQAYENATLTAFERFVGWPRERACSTLSGWILLVSLDSDATGNWLTTDGFSLMGLTVLEKKTIFVGLHTWVDSALAHEMAHVIEHGLGLPEARGNHQRWTERGICDAINSVSRFYHNDCNKPGFSYFVRPSFYPWRHR